MTVQFVLAPVPALGRPTSDPSEYADLVRAMDSDRDNARAATVPSESEAKALISTLRSDVQKLGLDASLRSRQTVDKKTGKVTVSVWMTKRIVQNRKAKDDQTDAGSDS